MKNHNNPNSTPEDSLYHTTSFTLSTTESTTESEQGKERLIETQFTQPVINLPERPAFHKEAFDVNYQFISHKKLGIKDKVKQYAQNGCPTNECLWNFAKARFPILVWLPEYQWKSNILSDVIAGITIAIMHVSLGMAFATLAYMPAITGLYVAFFSNLLYTFVGSAHHLALCGTAVISVMIGEVVQRVTHPIEPESPFEGYPHSYNGTLPAVFPQLPLMPSSPIQSREEVNAISVATAITMVAGIIHIITGTFRLGGLAVYLSDTMLSGFLAGTACHVFTSQMAALFGLKIPAFSSPVKVFKIIAAVCARLPKANVATIITSGTTLVFMLSAKYLSSRFLTAMPFPLPLELFAVLTGTLVSYYLDFKEVYNVAIVGYIPTGLPAPTVPSLWIIPNILLDSIIICIVSYTITLSFGLVFAKKHGYNVNSNQELLALGIINICGSFFQCVPCSVGMSRTMAQEAAGCRSLMTNFVASIILLFAILFIGPIFRTLPSCILSVIVMIALKGMFSQVKTLRKAWSISLLEASMWIVAFLAVTILDVGIGLGIGLLYSLIIIVVRTQWPYACLLGKIPGTDMYLDITKYQGAVETPGIKIFHFSSFLYFVNKEFFKSELYRLVGVDPARVVPETAPPYWTSTPMQSEDLLLIPSKDKNLPAYGSIRVNVPEESFNDSYSIPIGQPKATPTKNVPLHHIIIDASGWSYIDLPGIEALIQVIEDFKAIDIIVFIAGCQAHVSEKLAATEFYQQGNKHVVFPSMHDAMAYAEMEGSSVSR